MHATCNYGASGLVRFRSLQRGAFTLVEVLVVIAIIGVLVSLTLPALEMAQESARRGSCANNLRQLAVAVRLHTTAQQTFPTGGWGPDWVGDPDGGFGTKQPGGWVYNTLPYLEEQSLRDFGRGLPPEQKKTEMSKVLATPIPVLYCPSRRLPRAYGYHGPATLQNAIPPEKVAKSDYAINTQISSEKSEVLPSTILLMAGMSKTVLAGEKSFGTSPDYAKGGPGDGLPVYVGNCDDIARAAAGAPGPDGSAGSGFGSIHPDGTNIAFCDGSVRFVASDEGF